MDIALYRIANIHNMSIYIHKATNYNICNKKIEGIDHILVYVDVAVLGSTPARTGNSLNE